MNTARETAMHSKTQALGNAGANYGSLKNGDIVQIAASPIAADGFGVTFSFSASPLDGLAAVLLKATSPRRVFL